MGQHKSHRLMDTPESSYTPRSYRDTGEHRCNTCHVSARNRPPKRHGEDQPRIKHHPLAQNVANNRQPKILSVALTTEPSRISGSMNSGIVQTDVFFCRSGGYDYFSCLSTRPNHFHLLRIFIGVTKCV